MAKGCVLLSLLITCVIFLPYVCCQLPVDNEDDWIDPTDMFNFDSDTRKMRKKGTSTAQICEDYLKRLESMFPASLTGEVHDGQPAEDSSKELKPLAERWSYVVSKLDALIHNVKTTPNGEGSCTIKENTEFGVLEKKYKQLEETYAQCQSEKKTLSQQLADTAACHEYTHCRERLLFRQYIRSLLHYFHPHRTETKIQTSEQDADLLRNLFTQSSDDISDSPVAEKDVTYEMYVTLSAEDVATLQKYAWAKGESGRPADAHEVLEHMIQHVRTSSVPRVSIVERLETLLGVDIASLLQAASVFLMASVGITLLVRIHVPWRHLVVRFMLLNFFISVPWNWWHMYKVAVAKQHAAILRDAPSACRPANQTALESFFSWTRTVFSFRLDECAEYHEKLLVHPMWEVSFSQALAMTLSQFVLEPFRHIGSALSDLVRGMFKDLPVHLWPVVLALFVFLILVLLIFGCGYGVNIFHLFRLEPPRPRPIVMLPDPSQNQPAAVQDVPPQAVAHHATPPVAAPLQPVVAAALPVASANPPVASATPPVVPAAPPVAPAAPAAQLPGLEQQGAEDLHPVETDVPHRRRELSEAATHLRETHSEDGILPSHHREAPHVQAARLETGVTDLPPSTGTGEHEAPEELHLSTEETGLAAAAADHDPSLEVYEVRGSRSLDSETARPSRDGDTAVHNQAAGDGLHSAVPISGLHHSAAAQQDADLLSASRGASTGATREPSGVNLPPGSAPGTAGPTDPVPGTGEPSRYPVPPVQEIGAAIPPPEPSTQ